MNPVAFPLGPQYTVAATFGHAAGPPVVAIVNDAGDFVAAWESFETDGSGIGVYAQRFNANGTPNGNAVLVNETTAGNQFHPAIAADGAGKFVIAWQSEAAGGGAYDIMYKPGDVTQAEWLAASETVVNTTTAGSQTEPAAAMDANGNFVIAWQTNQDAAATGWDVFARYGTGSGTLIGTEQAVAAGKGDEQTPAAAMAAAKQGDQLHDGNGHLIIAWAGPGPVSEEEGEATNVIRGSLFTYDPAFTLTPVADHTDYQLSAAVQHDQVNPDVAMALDGRFVVVWQAEGQQGSGSDIFSRRFNPAGDGVDATDQPVNPTTKEPQRYPAVGMDQDGKYLVVWQSQQFDAKSWGIVGRAFNANGKEVRGEFIVNDAVQQGPQTTPNVTVAPNGSTVAVWAGPFVPTHGGHDGEEEGVEGEGGHQPAIHARLFNATGTADLASPLSDAGTFEFQLALTGASEDVPSAAASLGNGKYVVVWESFEEASDPSGTGVYGQIVNAAGTPIGPKFLVNETTLGYQGFPAVTELPGGKFVVAWQSETRTANGYDLYARVYNADGTPATGEFLVNESTQSGRQGRPSIASDAAGNFVVVWETDAQLAAPGEDLTEIYARRYTAAGSPIGAEFRVNTETAKGQFSPQVAMNASGQFAVVWVSDHPSVDDPNDTEKSIFVRWFAANGTPAGPEFLANTYTKDAQEHPDVGIDAAGNLVVVWQSINQETGGEGVSWGVFARQFAPNGTSPQTEEFRVNETVASPQRFPSVGVDEDGFFHIAWQTINQDGGSWGVFQRHFRPDGTPETGEQVVNTVTMGPQILPVYAMERSGDYALFWSGTAANHVDGIAGRSFQANTAPVVIGPEGKLSPVTVNEDAAPSAVDLFAQVQDDFDADSALTYEVVGNTNPGLFSGVSFDPATGRLTLAYAPNASGTATLTIRITDTYGLSTDTTLAVTVRPVADAPALTTLPSVGGERTAISLPLTVSLTDTDGSEVLGPVLIEGVPAGVSLSAGTNLGGGRWSVPVDQLAGLTLMSELERAFTLVITATSTEQANGSTASTTRTMSVTVNPVADPPALTVANGTGNERQAIPLTIVGDVIDTDGTEVLSVLIEGVPAGATLSAGTNLGGGRWQLAASELTGLTFTGEFEGTFTLTVTATATELGNGDTAATTKTLQVTVNPVADAPTLSVADAAGNERRPIPLAITAIPVDTDGTEEVTITISGVPAGAVLSAGTDLGGGVWELTAADLPGLTIALPFEMTADLTVTATAREQASGETATTVRTLTVTAAAVDYFAVGAGTGGGPVVKTFNLDGTERSAFFAYDPSFRGGVNVAVGDVTGDGIPDVVTGPGPGGGPHVKVFDGATGAEVRSFFAFDPSFRGGVTVATGDVNGDGVEDIIVAPATAGGPHVRVFDGRTGAELKSFFAYDPSFRGGVNVAAGDLDGDGFAEIVTGAGEGGGPHVKVFDGRTGVLIHNFFAGDPTSRAGAFVSIGNVQGDGRLDLVVGSGAGAGGTSRVHIYDGHDLRPVSQFDAFEESFTCGVRVGTIDLDGDGRDEVLLGPCPRGGPRVRVIDGVTGDELTNFFAFEPTFLGGVAVGG